MRYSVIILVVHPKTHCTNRNRLERIPKKKESNMPDATSTARREESAERLARPLIQLAKAWGVATCYIDQLGTYVEIRDEVLVSVLRALGVDASTPELIADALEQSRSADHELLVAPTVVKFLGTPARAQLRTKHGEPRVTLKLEDGSDANAAVKLAFSEHDGDVDVYELGIDDELAIGYHTLHVVDGEREATATLICAPASIPVPQPEQKRWGWMAQMYSVRSPQSWGVGDYEDLRELLRGAAESGADFMLINPVHATAPVSPLEPSPYSPMSRRFLNATYIRPQSIPEFNELSPKDMITVKELHEEVAADNYDSAPMDINAAWQAKRKALRIIFDQPRSAERQAAFEAFKKESGSDLDTWALWSVAFEELGEPWVEDSWFYTEARNSARITALREEHADLYEFACWLQWIAEDQIEAAQRTALDAGMSLGLMQDMAVGVHSFGADVWGNPERFAVGSVTVGCPPDFYNQQGQDWGQPPLNPNYLEATGYQMYREMVGHMFAHAGAIRIDHILGLFRLWWIPAGEGAKGGAYVAYNYEAMIAVLSIEATRAHGMVIGEDLGTVPEYVSKVLADHGLLGTTVEWFARVDNSPNAGDPYAMPQTYRKFSLSSVTTHDLPPTAGYLMLEQVKLREKLGLLSEPVEEFRESCLNERKAMLDLLVSGGWLSQEAADDVPNNLQTIVEAMHAMLTDAPSLLLQAALVDGVGEERAQNQPGTSTEYPNWRIPLADEHRKVVMTEDVFKSPRVQSLAAIMNRINK